MQTMFSMDRIKEVQNETIRAAKEERVMTEQFEISKHLAEWLGYKVVGVSEPTANESSDEQSEERP